MLEWFEKRAPIRLKFRFLLAVHALFGMLAVIGTAAAWAQWPLLAASLGSIALIGHVMAVVIGGRLICDPYVDTVVRMEGLADGDLESPVLYTDHLDCVGRMTRAMSVFKANALRASSAEEVEQVVNDLASGLSSMAAGDLTARITSSFPEKYDSLRKSFNATAERLDELLATVNLSAQNVLSASSEIRAASTDLSKRTEQQANSLVETSASVNEVNALVQETANSADKVSSSIAATYKEAVEGGEIVERAVDAMSAIQSSSNEITQIISLMDGIAFQTNLLALNAGVEAARAGDAGKGFAVVANEVRALAQRSADAARDIKDLITNSSQQVSAGVTLVEETGTMLTAIVHRVGEVTHLVDGISSASVTQATRVTEVNGTISAIESMTQQNAAMVEESTPATQAMAAQIEKLAELVSKFRISQHRASDRSIYRSAA